MGKRVARSGQGRQASFAGKFFVGLGVLQSMKVPGLLVGAVIVVERLRAQLVDRSRGGIAPLTLALELANVARTRLRNRRATLERPAVS